jgi:hypothetical protein
MTRAWACPNGNAWWPQLSPNAQWVAFGNQAAFITDLDTKAEFRVPLQHPQGVCNYPHGWLSDDEVLVSEIYGEPGEPRILYAVKVPDFSIRPIPYDPAMAAGYQVRASQGHIATWYGKDGRVSYDGAPLLRADGTPMTGHHSVFLSGDWLLTMDAARNYQFMVYQAGQLHHEVPHGPQNVMGVTDGFIGFGYPGCLAADPIGAVVDLSLGSWIPEGHPTLVWDGPTLWAWTELWDEAAQVGRFFGRPVLDAAGHLVRTTDVLMVESDCPLDASIRATETDWVFAGYAAEHNAARLKVWSLPKATALRPVTEVAPAPPPPPPPEASFSLDRTEGPVPLTVTARLTSQHLTTWRWTLDGVIHQPIEGQTHGFEILMPGTHTIGLRTMPAVDVPVQTVTALPAPVVVVPPATTPEAYWRMQTFDWINEAEAAELQRRKWAGVRVEGTNYDVVMDQCRRYNLRPLWILDRGEHKACPGHIDVSLGNEQNDGCGKKWPKLTPREYSDWVLDAWPTLRDKGCVVYVGEANNTSVSGLAWTREVLSRLPFHPQLRLGIHRYPKNPKDQRPETPQDGHRTIAEENAAILDVARGRTIGLTEAGLMDVQFRSWAFDRYFGKRRWRLAVDGHRYQAKRFLDLGSMVYVVYQIHSGGDDLYGQFVSGKWSATSNLPMEAL